MPTDTLQSSSRSRAGSFVAGAIAYSLGVFGLLKLEWVETHALLPFTQWQGRVAASAIGAPALPIDVTLACSGADAFALCAGAILAYPAPWRLRFGGTAAGFALVLILNAVRIGTLGRAAASPVLFEALHVYVWPTALILAIAGYVFGWMSWVNARSAQAPSRHAAAATPGRLAAVFAAWAVIFVVLFVAASSLYLQSHAVLIAAAGVARVAAAALRGLGMEASASANILWTAKGGFQVTQECIATPLIPLFFAAIMTFVAHWRWRLLAMAAAVPVFLALGVARLLVVALPAAVIGSPLFLIHAFYQIVAAMLVVGVVAVWRRGAPAWRVSVTACVAGVLSAWLLAPVYAVVLSALGVTLPFNDAQGAMAALPAFQAGLFVALVIAALPDFGWRSCSTGLAALVVVQAAALVLLHVISATTEWAPQIRDVRAWGIAAPLAIVGIGLIFHERARR